MFLVLCCSQIVGQHTRVVPMVFCCSQNFHGRTDMPILLGQHLIVAVDSKWVLFVAVTCRTVALGSCHWLWLILIWNGIYRIDSPFPPSSVCDCPVVLAVLCSFSWSLLWVQLMLHCPWDVLWVWLLLLPLVVPIRQGKLLSLSPLTCFSLVLHLCYFRRLLLTPLCTDFRCSMWLGINLVGPCTLFCLRCGSWCIRLSSSFVEAWLVSRLLFPLPLGSLEAFWSTWLPVVAISCVLSASRRIRGSAFVLPLMLSLAMLCSSQHLSPVSMSPRLGISLRHGGIWSFGRWKVSYRHLRFPLAFSSLFVVLILSKVSLLSSCTLGARGVCSLWLWVCPPCGTWLLCLLVRRWWCIRFQPFYSRWWVTWWGPAVCLLSSLLLTVVQMGVVLFQWPWVSSRPEGTPLVLMVLFLVSSVLLLRK